MRRFYHYSYHRKQNYVGFVIVILAILVYLSVDLFHDNYHDPDEFTGCDADDFDLMCSKD